MSKKRIAILGSTGSIGSNALAVVEAHSERLEVVGLAAGQNVQLFASQVARFRPTAIAMATAEALAEVRAGAQGVQAAGVGVNGLVDVATRPDVDLVLFASSGTAGLEAVVAAIDAGKTIALANKEILVMAGGIVTDAARRRNVQILPVDSEHNAIHQCLRGCGPGDVQRIVLTASGGPFRGRSASALETVVPEDALRHPTWQMGPKITVDSATLMNKGLEVIEAHWLFGVPAARIEVVIHPQSIVHSIVELRDGSMIAQLGVTDMRLPIQYAFSFPERWDAILPPLELYRCGRLDFDLPDHESFPCLRLAYRALDAGPSVAVVLNAANEVAVQSFLDGQLPFTGIARLIERTMDAHTPQAVDTIAAVREVDRWAREYSREHARETDLKV
jgi:1-deoxy-D-xylulose-5-phosphate reductoisomerase